MDIKTWSTTTSYLNAFEYGEFLESAQGHVNGLTQHRWGCKRDEYEAEEISGSTIDA